MNATHLAHSLGAAERTVRRAVSDGTIQSHRLGKRTLFVSEAEESYLASHWSLLLALRKELRTEGNVRLAVLFGSTARGDDHESSDIDLLVVMRDGRVLHLSRLADRLESLTGREVQLVRMSEAQKKPPFLLRILGEGRVLVDRDGDWRRLQARRASLERKARDYDCSMKRQARAALAGPRSF